MATASQGPVEGEDVTCHTGKLETLRDLSGTAVLTGYRVDRHPF